ncbi:MAG TPA: hypothetical protein VJL83_02285 [Patescibacteria group bacterium]|nr:hypothetical protein [Patescibacteria group bacterium]
MNPQEPTVVKTLCYADIFDFPLTREEIDKYQVSSIRYKVISNNQIIRDKNIDEKGNYYFLKGREKIVEIRKKREKYSQHKLTRAKRLASFFKIIPTIKLLAVTGALAVGNAKSDDDIDLMIVTSRGWIWTTRFLTILLAEIFSARRRPKTKELRDKLCFNMFVDEGHLSVPSHERDLFSAHEVAQVKVLWSRDGIAERFYEGNKWVLNYLPCAFEITKLRNYETKKKEKNIFLISLFLNFLELSMKNIQLTYMQSRRTNEVVKDGYLRFHPNDARKWILRAYRVRFNKYGIYDII